MRADVTTADVNGLAMAYAVAGKADGPAVVLHHPLATNLDTWDALTAALAPTYRVVRFDARGHGRTSAPKGAYTFETLAADVVALMDHLRIEKAHFLGLSMGGMVGQYLGILHPGRFKSLCLASTTSRVPAEAAPMWRERITSVTQGGMATTIEAALARWVSEATRRTRPELIGRLVAMMEATPPDGYIGWCHAIGGLDITGRLNEIRLPTQVIVGALDPSTPPAAAAVIHGQIAGAELVEIPLVSHMLQEEEPAALAAAYLAFLARHAAA